MPENNLFRKIADRGYTALLPIVPPGATISERSTLYARKDAVGKIPGVRAGDGCWRGFDWLKHATTRADLEQWASWGAGVGLRLGKDVGGVYAIDCDTLDQTQAEYVWFAFGEAFGPQSAAQARRFGRKPKWLSLVRCAEDVKYTRVEFSGYDGIRERVELLGAGRQCVVAGVHPGTGRPYEWDTPDGLPPALDATPVVSAAQIEGFFAALAGTLPACSKPLHEGGERPVNQDLLKGRLDDVRKAVAVLPNKSADFPTRNDYLKVGYAIKAALQDEPDDALDLWLQWCGRWSDDPYGRTNDPEKTLQDWRRMKPPYGLGAGWLYQTADDLGGFNVGSVWFEPVEERLEFGLDTEPAGGGSPAGSRVGKISRLPDIGLGDAAERWSQECAEPLVEGLMDKGAMTILYGQSNVGKTFVAMDIAAHIATGEPWGGRKVAQGVVVYVVAEGSRGAYKRAAALRKKLDGLASAPFRFIMHPVDLRNPTGDLAALLAALREIEQEHGPIALVVIDTLSRAMAGGDENTSTDMGLIVRHFDAVRAQTRAHLLIVHHAGKDDAKGARGHSLLRAAVDTEIAIKDGVIEVEKQRDMEMGAPIRFELVSVEIGVDGDGKPVTSATVRLPNAMEADSKGRAQGKPTRSEMAVYEAVMALTENEQGRRSGAPVAEITAHLLAQGNDIQISVVRVLLRRLNEKNLVRPVTRGHWAAFSGAVYDPDIRNKIETAIETNVFD